MTGDEDCPSIGPYPYCDTPEGKAAPACHDRQDYNEGGKYDGMATCNDGTHEEDYKDCKDATKKDLPICEYKVVKDCVVNEIGQKCLVGTSDDPCRDIFYGYDGDLKPGEKTFNPNNDNDNGGSNSGSGSDDLPGCQNGVLQKCVIKQIGLICHPEDRYAPTNPSVVGGGHACQDVYAGHYVYDTKEYKPGEIIGQSDDGSVLKNCGDGIIAVSCGVGRYQCMNGDGSDKSFHTNDYRDCEEP